METIQLTEELGLLPILEPDKKERRQIFKQQAIERTGQVRMNNMGSLMVVDEYNSSTDVWIRFPQGNLVKSTWQQFLSGNVKNVWDKSVFNVGFIGGGKYKISENGKPTSTYITWHAMMTRCYSERVKEKQPTYKDCRVTDEWHNFQNFAAWYDENYYAIEGQKRMDLDKDILHKHNRIYSPDTCVFVPHDINLLFVRRESLRGSLPIGVKRKGNKFEAQCREGNNKRGYIGLFETPAEAFKAYKSYKEKRIKEVAEAYRSRIPENLYRAMISYKISIND
ncbi:hypothetical protein [Heyndrickxia acidicola]|uniref:hypothetical protein n=1 Tax=Heyndrickxia acidicola TaxID=209389 RepID=UPI000A020F70|nr:hypothetical protein [Heyndrickxia acidicola]